MRQLLLTTVFTLLMVAGYAQSNPWQSDLEKLRELVMAKSGYIFQVYDQQAWVRDYDALLQSSSTMTKDEIRVALMVLIAKLQDGHSGIWIQEMVIPTEGVKWFPIRMYYFKEGLYVIAADEKYADFIGSRVERFGNLSVDEASQKLFEISNGENEYGDMFKVPFLMIYPSIITGLGLIDDPNVLPLTVRSADGSVHEIAVESQTYGEGVSQFFDRFEAPAANSVRMDAQASITWPSTKWSVDPPYRVDYIAERKTAYLQMNVLRDPPGHSLMDNYENFWRIVETKEVEKIIIDLRNNGGGNLHNAWPFVFKLRANAHLNQENKLIVLVGRKTFSAATAFMSMLERHTEAVFMGEPSGGRPNQTEGTPVFPPPRLEKVGVDVLLSRGRWVHTHPEDEREYLVPDIQIEESITDWMAGYDRVYQKALELK